MNSQTGRRIFTGAIIAPLAAPPAFLMYGMASALIQEGPAGLKGLPLAVGIYLVFGLPIAYGAMIALGLPYVSWLQRRDRLTWLTVCLGATAIGGVALPGSLLLLGGGMHLANFIGGGLAGLASGVLFCIVCRPASSFNPKPFDGTV